jgi:hypothetical protein
LLRRRGSGTRRWAPEFRGAKGETDLRGRFFVLKGGDSWKSYKYNNKTYHCALPVSLKLTGVDEDNKANLKRKEYKK